MSDRIVSEDFAANAADEFDITEAGNKLVNINSRTSWQDLKRKFGEALPILDYILPVFREVEQWTQILSSF